MSVSFTQVEARKEGDSVVYGVTLEIDGILCQENGDDGELVPKIFRLQITNDVEDKAAAFQRWLNRVATAVREGRNPTPPPSLNEILGVE